ncbi:MAG: pilus assembly protein [Eubacterium sp.]|nr:pilus assembly protein [Eubacterium sp.]
MKKSADPKKRITAQWLTRGSLTVEASVIVPVTVILAALLMVLFFYVHNRNWYQAAAAEVCLTGNSRYDTGVDAGEIARQKAVERADRQIMPASRPEIEVACGKSGTSASFSNQRFPAFQKFFHLSVRADVDKVAPVDALRLARAVKHTVEEGQGREEEDR